MRRYSRARIKELGGEIGAVRPNDGVQLGAQENTEFSGEAPSLVPGFVRGNSLLGGLTIPAHSLLA